jgi:hypothetical protein
MALLRVICPGLDMVSKKMKVMRWFSPFLKKKENVFSLEENG